MRVIALLTDFGTVDGYVAAMKGRILTLAPQATVVDITHDIPPFDIRSGAFTLYNCYRQFPPQTVFVAVVDPGVGTRRAGVVLQSDHYVFVGPDNGLFSLVLQNESVSAYHIRTDQLPWEVSHTFHGRDVFAPLGALAVANPEEMMTYLAPANHPLQTFWTPPRWETPTRIRAEVLHVDRFGNIILNIRRPDFGEQPLDRLRVTVKGHDIAGLKKTFGDVRPGELLINFDSSDFLQIAKNQGNAARELQVQPGDEVLIHL